MIKRCNILFLLVLAGIRTADAQQAAQAYQLEVDGRIREAFQRYLAAAASSNTDAPIAYEGAVRCARELLAGGAADDELRQGLQKASQWLNARPGDPSQIAAVDSLVLVYLRQNRAAEAGDVYKTANITLANVAREPNFAFNFARVQDLTGHRAEAFLAYMAVLAITPDVERAAEGAIQTASSSQEATELTDLLSRTAPGAIAIPTILNSLERWDDPRTVVHLARADLRARLSISDFRLIEQSRLATIASRLQSGEMGNLIRELIAAFTGTISADAPEDAFQTWNESDERRSVMSALLTQVATQFSPGATPADQAILRHAAAVRLWPLDPTIVSRYISARLPRLDFRVWNTSEVDVAAMRVLEAVKRNPELPDPDDLKEDALRLNTLVASIATDALPYRRRAAELDDEISIGSHSRYPGVQELVGLEYERHGQPTEAAAALAKARAGYEDSGESTGLLRVIEAQRRDGKLAQIVAPGGLIDMAVFYQPGRSFPTVFGIMREQPYVQIGESDSNGVVSWIEVPVPWAPSAMTIAETANPRQNAVALIAGSSGRFGLVDLQTRVAHTLRPRMGAGAPPRSPTALAAYEFTGDSLHFLAAYPGERDGCVAEFLVRGGPSNATYELLRWLPPSGTRCDVAEIAIDADNTTVYTLNSGRIDGTPLATAGGSSTTSVPVSAAERNRIYFEGRATMLLAESAGVISLSPAGSDAKHPVWAGPSSVINIRPCVGWVRSCAAVLTEGQVEIINLLQKPGGNPKTNSACDLNGDGVVNVTDVQIAVNQALGMASCSGAAALGLAECNIISVQRIVNASAGGACVVDKH